MRYSAKVVMILVICVLAGSSHTALAEPNHPGFAHLLLNVTPDGDWVTGGGDTWFVSTTATNLDSFILSITNDKDRDAAYLHLLVASNIIDEGNFSIYINGTHIDIPDEIRDLSFYNLAYIQIGNDGIYSTYYQDVDLECGIGANETVNVTVLIDVSPYLPEDLKIHFDAVGLDSDGKTPVLKAANAHDVTYYHEASDAFIPEFPTIALPMLSILGLMFILSKKYKGG